VGSRRSKVESRKWGNSGKGFLSGWHRRLAGVGGRGEHRPGHRTRRTPAIRWCHPERGRRARGTPARAPHSPNTGETPVPPGERSTGEGNTGQVTALAEHRRDAGATRREVDGRGEHRPGHRTRRTPARRRCHPERGRRARGTPARSPHAPNTGETPVPPGGEVDGRGRHRPGHRTRRTPARRRCHPERGRRARGTPARAPHAPNTGETPVPPGERSTGEGNTGQVTALAEHRRDAGATRREVDGRGGTPARSPHAPNTGDTLVPPGERSTGEGNTGQGTALAEHRRDAGATRREVDGRGRHRQGHRTRRTPARRRCHPEGRSLYAAALAGELAVSRAGKRRQAHFPQTWRNVAPCEKCACHDFPPVLRSTLSRRKPVPP